MTKTSWQRIALCAVLGGAGACSGPLDFQDPDRRTPRGEAGTGVGADAGWDGSQPDAGPSEWPEEMKDSGLAPEHPNEDEETPGECGASSFEAERVVVTREVMVESQVTTVKPVSLYVLFDKSMSMGPGTVLYPGGKNIWDPAVTAMKSFLNDSKSKDIGVGIQYFPKGGASCNGTGYSTPAVDVGQLPASAATLSQSLDNANPDGTSTPIEGALRGATGFCKQYQAAHPEEQCVAVIVTDGKPELDNCEKNADKLAAIVAAAKADKVTTFAVGLEGADFALLDKIAVAGGAPDCQPGSSRYACDVSKDAGGPTKLTDALASIRDTVVTTEVTTVIETHEESTTLPCTWTIPEQPEGKQFDPDKINIRLTTPEAETTFVRVPSDGACEGNAWHFDDPSNPKQLVACAQACEHIASRPEGKIEVLMGCATVVPQ